MPSFDVAHLREQGQDMIIVPVNSSFSRQSTSEQQSFIREVQEAATSAGLGGTVVPVWNGGFIAPRPWHPFFRSLSPRTVAANINRKLSW
jgi:hypothetical protein